MSRNNKEITDLVFKYRKPDENVRHISELILNDIKYLEEHSVRTCKNHYSIIPSFPIKVYGDGGADYLFKKTLTLFGDFWRKKNSEYFLTLEEIIEDMLTMTHIMGKIFCHEKDKESRNREELSNINAEFIEDFVMLNKCFISVYETDIAKQLGLWVSYSHCQRYCDKIKNFLEELKK